MRPFLRWRPALVAIACALAATACDRGSSRQTSNALKQEGLGGAARAEPALKDEIPPDPAVLAAAEREEQRLEGSLNEIVADLDEPLDASLIAEILRRRMGADVGLQTSGAAIDRPATGVRTPRPSRGRPRRLPRPVRSPPVGTDRALG